MHNGICPKCQAADIYRGLAAEGEGLTAGSYPAQVELIAGYKQVTVQLDTYVCQVCGYIEMYAANPGELAWLPQAEGWMKVATQP